MSVIRLQEMTPQIYTEESRDFQLLSRLYDSVFNGLKFDTDSILDLIDTKECRTSVLQLLQTKLGFFTERKIDDEKLRSILECFPILVRNKGSLRAIKETLYLFLRMYSVSSNMEIYYLPTPYSPPFSEEEPCVLASGKLPENNSLVIRIHSFETKPDTSVMEEIFKYILPAGINYYIEFDKGATLQDIVLKSEDSAELTFVSDNINSQLRSSDQTEPYNIGTVNTSSLISTDSYVSNRFIGYYGDEQSASDYLATLVDKIYSTAVINYSATGEVSGPIVSISDAEAGAPVEALSVEVEPIQDLHGYDSPWPAGGGANKWDEGWTGGKILNSDGTISDTSAKRGVSSYVPVVAGETYCYVNKDINSGKGRAAFYDAAYNLVEYVADFPATLIAETDRLYSVFTVPSGASYLRFNPTNVYGATYKNDISINYPSTITTYSPYSNICPIYGHTDADVTRTGKNLIPTPVATNAIKYNGSGLSVADVTNGVAVTGQASGSSHSVGFILLDADYFIGKTLTLSLAMVGSNSSPRAVVMYCDADCTNRSVVQVLNETGSITFTVPSTAKGKKIGLVLFSTSGQDSLSAVSTYTNIQLELGSTATAYSPYVGTTYPIPLGQTVYGGTLDVVTGVLTVDRVMDTFTKDSAWYGFSTGTGNSSAIVQLTEYQNCLYISGIAARNGAVSSTGKEAQNYWFGARQNEVPGDGDMCFAYSSTGQLRFHRTDVANITDLASFKANFPDTQIVYELATPTAIQLTPTQVELLLGENNLWSDAGDISITYKRDGTYKAMICTAYSSNTPTWYRINFLGNLTTEEVSTQGGIVSALQAKGITVNNGDLIKYNNLYLLRVNNDWQECNYARYILNTYHLTE